MKLPQYFISIVTIFVLSFSGLFYFINQNHKKTTENSLEINQSRKTIKKIDAAFYTISELERNTQKYVITGNKDIEKNVENEIAELHDIIQELDESAKINPEGFDFLPLLVKKLDSHKYIRKNKLTAKEITTFLSNNADEKKSLRFYELVNETKQAYVKKTNNLLEKSQAINAISFKSSLIVCLVSILLIIITLLHETRNKKLRKLAENDTRQIEIKYKNLVDNSGVGLLTTDLNGHITYVNKRITAFTGFQHSEMIGRHFSSVVDAEWVQTITEKLKKQFQLRQEGSDITYPLSVKSGNRIWVEQSSVILMENGEPLGFQCIIKDITEKRKIEEELKKIESEREENQFRLQSILDNTPLMIFIKDVKGRYLLANKSYKEAFHFTSEQMIGKTDFDLVAESDAERYKEIDEYVIKEQKNVEVEETVEVTRGTIETLQIHKKMFFNRRFGILGILSYPYWLFYELLAPLIEFSGFIGLAIFAMAGYISWPFFLLLLAFILFFGFLYSVFAILIEVITFNQYKRRSDILKLILLAFAEPFFFHPFVVWSAVRGNIDFLRKKKSWGEMTRQGFNNKKK